MKKIQTINNSIAVLTGALDALTRANTSISLQNVAEGADTHANEMKTITKKIVKLSKKL